jgi:hypothetical protein
MNYFKGKLTNSILEKAISARRLIKTILAVAVLFEDLLQGQSQIVLRNQVY